MAAMSRRDSFKATLVRLNKETKEAGFEQASMIKCKEMLKLVSKMYDSYTDKHLQVLDEVVNDEGMKVQEEALDAVTQIYLEANCNIQQRIDQLLDIEVARDLDVSREIARNRERSSGNFINLTVTPPNTSNNGVQSDNQNPVLNASAAQVPSQVQGQVQSQVPLTARPIYRMTEPKSKLERMEITVFSGEQSEWPEWKSSFETLVHNEASYTDTEKFFYLKKSLRGVASNLLKGWQATGENYEAAYNSVVEVFENKYRMIMAHLSELFKIPHLSQETFGGLRTMIDTTKCVIRQLQVAGSPVNTWDHVVVFVLVSRMPPRTLTYWENSNDLIEMPTLKQVLDFLEKRARSQVNFTQSLAQSSDTNQSSINQSGMNQSSTNQSRNTSSNGFKQKQRSSSFVKANNGASMTNNSNGQRGVTCYNCKGPHPMFHCPNLWPISVDERIARVRQLQLCENCFSPNHRTGATICRGKECGRCKRGNHNSILCRLPLATSNALVLHQPNQMMPSSTQSSAMAVNTYRQPNSGEAQAHWTPQAPVNYNQPQNF